MSAARPFAPVLACLLLLSPAVAPAAEWSREFQPMGLGAPSGHQGQALTLGTWSDELVVAGWFTSAGGLPASNVALWNGSTWRVLDGGPNGEVRAAYDGGTALWLGGVFTQVDGQPQPGVACWDGVNQRWTDLGDPGGYAYDFEYFNGHLYAGGMFYTGDPYGMYAPLAYHSIDGWHYDLQYEDFDGPNVYALQSWLGSLYIGGAFWLDFPNALSLMRWDGEDLYGYYVDGNVLCLEPTDGGLYAGGWFDECDGVVSHGLVHVGDAGFTPVSTPGDDFEVRAMHETTTSPMAIAADDSTIRTYSSGAWSSPLGGKLAGQPFAVRWFNGSLYAGGLFPNGVARWDAGTREWMNLGGGFQPGNSVSAVAAYDGEVYAGGMIGMSDASADFSAGYLFRWDGRGWRSVDGSTDDRVYALKPYQGSLIVGGDFDLAGGQPFARIARWDGSAWHDMGGANARVTSLCLDGAELVAGGWFTTIGSVTASRVARYDGASWHAYGGTVNGAVNAVASFRSDVVIGGSFTQAGSVAGGHVARWDGAAWQALGSGLDNTVQALTVWNGDLYAAGLFQNAGGAPASGIARWDGAAWHPLGDGLGGLDALHGVKTLLGARDLLFVGGAFTTAGGSPATGLAVWDGLGWSELGGGVHDATAGTTTRVEALAVMDGHLYLGGHFQRAGNVASSNFAQWIDGTIVPVMLAAFSATSAAGAAGSPRAVDVTWRLAAPVAATDLRLTARAGGATWDVPFAADPSGPSDQVYAARDAAPALAAAVSVTYTLRQAETVGAWVTLAERTVDFGDPLPAPLPPRLSAHPNPFNPRTELSFTLARPGPARLSLYTLTGRLVATLVDGERPAGAYGVDWDGRDARGHAVPSGSYVARLSTAEGVAVTKLVLLR